MQTMNSVNLLGNVGQDVEIYQFPDGGRKATLKIATNSGTGDNKKTQWHTLIFYNNAADIVSLLKRGDAICVSGSLEYRQWVDQYQQTRFTPEIIVDRFSIIKGDVGQIQGAEQQNYQGAHQQGHSQGSYQNIKGNGGFDNRNRNNQAPQNQGGYNNQPQNGGYNNRSNNQAQGGYNNQPQNGGYNNRSNNQSQGGYYNQQHNGGYNRQNSQRDMA